MLLAIRNERSIFPKSVAVGKLTIFGVAQIGLKGHSLEWMVKRKDLERYEENMIKTHCVKPKTLKELIKYTKK